MNYLFDPGARDDLEEASKFYFKIDPDLERRFSDFIDQAIEKILQDPFRWALVEDDDEVRSYVVDKFPYSILYATESRYILIVAVAHHSRHPDYWRERLN